MKDPELLAGKTLATDQVDGFLAIDANGNVLVFSGKVDLGTGIRTSMTQIAAEELSVPLSCVTVIQGDTLLTPDQGVTFGSLSIQNGGMQIRQAAATAREALAVEGAESWAQSARMSARATAASKPMGGASATRRSSVIAASR